jgi:hypothetical protein
MSGRSGGLALGALALAVLGLLLLLPAGGAASAGHYLPKAGDDFSYAETIVLSGGTGNYSGYSENSDYTGSIAVTGIAPNSTASATYQASGTFRNTTGSEPWSEQGSFTFSALTFRYVQGTDNQTGYTNPAVWFYMNASLGVGATFYSLDTTMTVVSTDAAFAYAPSSTGYARAIFAEGNGSYQRNDVYGSFAATYTLQAWYDPATGYILGYVSTEHDSNPAGDGFTVTDTLTDRATSFPITPAAAPPSGGGGSGSGGGLSVGALLVIGLVLVVVLAVVVGLAIRRARRGPSIPRHAGGAGTLPAYAPPPPINLIPRDQPVIQQVVLRETVKVPCQFCGTLIDSTAKVCPQCGAPRT